MITAARNISHADFRARVDRVNRSFARSGGYRRPSKPGRPIVSTLLGFGWIYVVIAVAINRKVIESSLRQGSLPQEYHNYIFGILTVLLAASTVLLGMHLLRFFYRRGSARSNSGGILLGAMGAMALVFTPDEVWKTGAALMDDRSRALLASAGDALEDRLKIDLASVALASSSGR